MFWKEWFRDKSRRTSQNDAVRDVLRRSGDDGSAIRHVVHYAYPRTGADPSQRDRVAADLSSRGFKVREAASNDGLVLEHHRAVAGQAFDDLTDELESWFEKRGWEYDGWECAVVRGRLN